MPPTGSESNAVNIRWISGALESASPTQAASSAAAISAMTSAETVVITLRWPGCRTRSRASESRPSAWSDCWFSTPFRAFAPLVMSPASTTHASDVNVSSSILVPAKTAPSAQCPGYPTPGGRFMAYCPLTVPGAYRSQRIGAVTPDNKTTPAWLPHDLERLDRRRSAGLRGDQGGIQPDGPVADLELLRELSEEALQDDVGADADDGVQRPGHADVGHVGRAAGQDARVRRLHVRVRAEHRRDAAVEVVAHGDLLARRLGVEVDDDGLG